MILAAPSNALNDLNPMDAFFSFKWFKSFTPLKAFKRGF
jgi:hypothetical protein